MHIYFSGIGGTAIGPLALIAKEVGHTVSGSDKQASNYIAYLKAHGVTNIHIGQDQAQIAAVHAANPIDWYVYSSAVAIENPNAPELLFCQQHTIRTSKRDELLSQILQDTGLQLIAIAGTHGKSTTTAMTIWLLKQLGIPVSYSVGAKTSFSDMGEYVPGSKYFAYECDEFDRNFLAFHPHIAMITGIDWDHPDIYPTRDDYNQAFRQFLSQCSSALVWDADTTRLQLAEHSQLPRTVIDSQDPHIAQLRLPGLVNRQNAWQVVCAVHQLTGQPQRQLIDHMNRFPGLARRFEQIVPGLYSDYAHTPPKIRGALQIAQEVAPDRVVVVYEGLHNTRQHFIRQELHTLFDDIKQLYVVPSYLAREDPSLQLLTPQDLIHGMSAQTQAHAAPADVDANLRAVIQRHLADGDTVVCITAGGGNSLDEWLRNTFGNAPATAAADQ